MLKKISYVKQSSKLHRRIPKLRERRCQIYGSIQATRRTL